MSYQDETLVCVGCGESFVFSASQQADFATKGLSTPKRCPACRRKKRQQRGRGQGQADDVYRAPAFRNSAPEHRSRGRFGSPERDGGQRGRRQGEYRSPAFRDLERRGEGIYRSPAFRDQTHDDEYRSPAFRDPSQDEYRSTAFKDSMWNEVESEYRAPGFRDRRDASSHERPMFLLECPECGKREMVPFLPEEKEHPLCSECFAKNRDSGGSD